MFETNTIDLIIDLHQRFELIHPFQDGNGRHQFFYYRGLREWGHINCYLSDTCLTAQDNYKALLDYFKIKY
ncbi:MAG: Fic family protein [Bacteroidales bacterium]|nr:Fic family protein [Bacteroidales bacterium]